MNTVDSNISTMTFGEISEKLMRCRIKKEAVLEVLNLRLKRQEELKNEVEVLLKSQALLQEVAKEVQSKLSVKIDSIVNLGLATCFGNEYKFELRYVSARGKTEVEFVLLKDGREIDPLNQNGGGLVDVLCFCLRVAVYNISRTGNVIVLDEPFKYVSKGLRDRTAELLHTLSERLGIQFIEVTHVQELVEHSDRQLAVKKVDGVSYVQ